MSDNQKEVEIKTDGEPSLTGLTDQDLDYLIRQEMKAMGYTKFINYQGEEEDL